MSNKPIALITGGSRGIGRELIKTFTQAGYHIITTTTQDTGIEAIQSELPDAEVILWNALHDSIQVITDVFTSTSRQPDVVICNAAITRDALAIRMSDAHWHDVYRVNTQATAELSTWALKCMYTKKSGCILLLSSVVAHTGNMGQANYIMSKSALEGLSRALAIEGAPRNIRVNCIAPGMIETDMTDKLSPALKESALKRIPLGFMGQPSDIAQCALYLTQATYITGQVIHVNGGMFFGS